MKFDYEGYELDTELVYVDKRGCEFNIRKERELEYRLVEYEGDRDAWHPLLDDLSEIRTVGPLLKRKWVPRVGEAVLVRDSGEGEWMISIFKGMEGSMYMASRYVGADEGVEWDYCKELSESMK